MMQGSPRSSRVTPPFLDVKIVRCAGYTLQRMLEETARHTQARVVPRMADITAALRRFLRERHEEVLANSPGATDTLQVVLLSPSSPARLTSSAQATHNSQRPKSPWQLTNASTPTQGGAHAGDDAS